MTATTPTPEPEVKTYKLHDDFVAMEKKSYATGKERGTDLSWKVLGGLVDHQRAKGTSLEGLNDSLDAAVGSYINARFWTGNAPQTDDEREAYELISNTFGGADKLKSIFDGAEELEAGAARKCGELGEIIAQSSAIGKIASNIWSTDSVADEIKMEHTQACLVQIGRQDLADSIKIPEQAVKYWQDEKLQLLGKLGQYRQ